MQMVETKAVEIGEYSHTRPWEQGTLTNIKQLFDAPLRLPDVVVFLTTLSSTMTQHPAIIEAAKMTIPTIGIVDTNCGKHLFNILCSDFINESCLEPNYITYPIPGSDDSVRTNEFYMDAFCQAIKFGKEAREQQDKESNKKASNK
jgi:small subunit ribosomal protein S2